MSQKRKVYSSKLRSQVALVAVRGEIRLSTGLLGAMAIATNGHQDEISPS